MAGVKKYFKLKEDTGVCEAATNLPMQKWRTFCNKRKAEAEDVHVDTRLSIMKEVEVTWLVLLGERSEPHTGVFNRDFG